MSSAIVGRYLADRDVAHAVIGAEALARHGIVRFSLDVDFLTLDQRVLSRDFWGDLAQGAVEVRRGDLLDPLAGIVRIVFPGSQADVVVGKYTWQRGVIDRATRIGDAPVVRKADLALLKVFAGGPQDLWDVHQLLASDRGIVAEVDRLVLDLPDDVQDSWRRLRDLQ